MRSCVAHPKARQAAKLREIREALVAEGYVRLDDQAAALGLSRSTTWTIISGTHKSSGLSSAVLNRMLSSPRLTPRVREKIIEYIEEKGFGRYGGSKVRLRKFVDQMKRVSGAHEEVSAWITLRLRRSLPVNDCRDPDERRVIEADTVGRPTHLAKHQ
jgi:hypothetical protein